MSDPQNEQGARSEAERPRPAYGEYAPEGWSWQPEEQPETAASPQSNAPVSASVQGVPHNLGVGGSASDAGASQTSTPPAQSSRGDAGDPPPYRAGQPHQNPAPQPAAAPRPRRRTGDIAITIVLLIIGAFGALYSAMVLFSMPPTLALVAEALEVSDFSVPGWVNTFATVSALGMFALYAVTLVFSIQRMRAGKLTFWVPLAAGVLATILTFVLTMIVMTNMPELMQAAQDPDAVQKLMDYMSTVDTSTVQP
ncbi:MAG: DUF6264 family protein [Leucobacter sp.]